MKLIYAAAIGIFAFVSKAYATSEEIMLNMIEFIEDNTTYEYNGEKLPYLILEDKDEMCRDLFEPEEAERRIQSKEGCTIAGYYDHFTNAIFISPEPVHGMVAPDHIEVVLVHELVHFLQWINGTYESVDCMNQLEEDGYKIQKLYIEQNGLDEKNLPNGLFALLASQCPRDMYR